MKNRFLVCSILFLNINLYSQVDINIDSLFVRFLNEPSYSGIFDDYSLFTLPGLTDYSNAENGFIILQNGDTIIGNVCLSFDGASAKIKNEKLNKKFRADKYKKLKYGNRYYFSKKLGNFPINAERLDSGKIKVYACERIERIGNPIGAPTLMHIIQFYFIKDSYIYGPFYADFRDYSDNLSLISECIGDYKPLLEKLKRKEINYSDLLIVIKIYNYWSKINFR